MHIPTARNTTTGHVHSKRFSAALLVGLGVWAFILLRLILIQVVHAPRLAGLAERQQVVEVKLAPERGQIYDRNMVCLTDNLTVSSICAYPGEIKSPRTVARGLARALGGSAASYEARLRKKTSFVWIERQVEPARAEALAALDLPGIEFLAETKRVYPFGRGACHVIGYTDIDGRGISGMESRMDDLLTGSEATVYYYMDSRRQRTPAPASTRTTPDDGMSVVLTIDMNLQAIAEVELERTVREYGAKSGIVVVQDPWTGDILAMANWPSFDCNRPDRFAEENWRNRAVTDQFEPGSTFKVFTACAALATGAADLTSVYYAFQGKGRFGSFTIRDVKPHGWMDFETALVKSSNVCFAQIAGEVGENPLYSYARDFGFGCLTAVNLPGEVRGTLREPTEWSSRSVHTIGIGQEVAVTAIQLVTAYSAIANGGFLMEPRIVKAVLDDDGRVAEEARPCVVRSVVDPEVAAAVRGIMFEVTERGTGMKASPSEVTVAGKTGTAQKVVPGIRGYAPGKWVSSFVGFAPAEEAGIVCLVLLDEPSGRGLGGQVAAPVFRRIVEQLIRGSGHDLVFGRQRLQRRANGDPLYCDAALNAASDMSASSDLGSEDRGFGIGESLITLAVPLQNLAGASENMTATIRPASGGVDAGDPARMPELRGMSVRAARRLASSLGLAVAFEGNGLVQTQSPRPGSGIEPGDRVFLTCAPG
ncbi:transpeptidase family protein [bacterium]|nr:transpeptidase family protein [bacterium]